MNGNGSIENLEILKGAKGNISLIVTTLEVKTLETKIDMIENASKEALTPLEIKRLERLENQFYKFSEDMGHIKALLTKVYRNNVLDIANS
ncbi:18849_t:CDS:2 [Funneliformis geosporum]|uniref:18849_t:CDS:1 n=1 Tax=Funneliformis geosporum TaxID=1117311 RepID=A0A9W4SM80_9GLOM|nr:18849_t:CDS:2 [Funneliformis geosporum]